MQLDRLFFVMVLISVIFNLSVKAQAPNCKKFRNGTFKMTYEGKKGIIKRYGNTQEEYLNGEGKPTLVFTVNWLSDCLYTLTPNIATRKAFPEIQKEGMMTVKIIKTTTSTYTYSATYAWDRKKVYENTLTLIK